MLVRNTTARNAIAMSIFHGLCTYVLPVSEALSAINIHNVKLMRLTELGITIKCE